MNIPVKTEATVLTDPGRWETTEADVLTSDPEEVPCGIDAVAICRSDPEIIHDRLAGIWPPSYPFTIGHERVGTVVTFGNKSEDFKIRDRVTREAHKGCGYCSNCLKGSHNLCLDCGRNNTEHRHYGFTSQGACAQCNIYHIESLFKLPDPVSFEEATMCDTTGAALHGLELAGVDPGSTVATIGPGPIGIMTMGPSRVVGTFKILAVGRTPCLEVIGSLSADELVDFSKCNPVDEAHRLTGGPGANLVLEYSGAPGTITQSFGMHCKGGEAVMFGVAKGGVTEPISLKYTTHSELILYGSEAGPNIGRRIVEMIAGGQLEIKDMVTHTFTLNGVNLAFGTFEKCIGGAMKAVIYPNR